MSSELTYREIRLIVKETLRSLGQLPIQVNQAEAYRRYTRRRVENLTRQGFLHPVKDEETGSKYFDVSELEEVMSRQNIFEKYKLKSKK